MSSNTETPNDTSLNENEKFVENLKEYRGWDLPSESYRIGDKSWKINKDCKKPVKEEKIRELSDKIEETRQKLDKDEIKSTDAIKIVRECNKEILEITLIRFNYEQEAEEFGHKALGQVSKVMQGIFLMFGSWEEMTYMIKQGSAENKVLLKLAREGLNG